MKAMTSPCYGGPETMALQDLPTPTPGDGEVLVAVRATSLQALDWHLQTGEPWILRLQQGLRRPKRTIHGVDIAGGEPVRHEGDPVGITTSGAFGHATGRSLGFAYVPTALAAPGQQLEVELLGDRRAATVLAAPVYDPANERLAS